MYDPVTGQFVSIDRIEDDPNAYRYVRNNPVNKIDPSGEGWMSLSSFTRTTDEASGSHPGVPEQPPLPPAADSPWRVFERPGPVVQPPLSPAPVASPQQGVGHMDTHLPVQFFDSRQRPPHFTYREDLERRAEAIKATEQSPADDEATELLDKRLSNFEHNLKGVRRLSGGYTPKQELAIRFGYAFNLVEDINEAAKERILDLQEEYENPRLSTHPDLRILQQEIRDLQDARTVLDYQAEIALPRRFIELGLDEVEYKFVGGNLISEYKQLTFGPGKGLKYAARVARGIEKTRWTERGVESVAFWSGLFVFRALASKMILGVSRAVIRQVAAIGMAPQGPELVALGVIAYSGLSKEEKAEVNGVAMLLLAAGEGTLAAKIAKELPLLAALMALHATDLGSTAMHNIATGEHDASRSVQIVTKALIKLGFDPGVAYLGAIALELFWLFKFLPAAQRDAALRRMRAACFPAGTPVAVESGQVAIETIQTGDRVWAFDHADACWKLEEVLEPLVRQYDGTVVSIEVGGETIRCTANHPFWVVDGEALETRPVPDHCAPTEPAEPCGRWVAAEDLEIGDVLTTRDGRNLPIAHLESTPAQIPIYNLHVANLHSFAVGKLEVLVHNSGGAAPSEVIRGPYGTVSRETLEAAARSEGSRVRMVTAKRALPKAGQELSVSVGEGAEELSSAVGPGRQFFRASIPKELIVRLEEAGLAEYRTTLMGGVQGTEIYFPPQATEFIVPFFK